jgi:hypothetical protein
LSFGADIEVCRSKIKGHAGSSARRRRTDRRIFNSNFTLKDFTFPQDGSEAGTNPVLGDLETHKDFAMIGHYNRNRRQQLADDVRHQFKEQATARFLNALPTFHVVDDLPGHLNDLLRRLEQAERSVEAKTGARSASGK